MPPYISVGLPIRPQRPGALACIMRGSPKANRPSSADRERPNPARVSCPLSYMLSCRPTAVKSFCRPPPRVPPHVGRRIACKNRVREIEPEIPRRFQQHSRPRLAARRIGACQFRAVIAAVQTRPRFMGQLSSMRRSIASRSSIRHHTLADALLVGDDNDRQPGIV